MIAFDVMRISDSGEFLPLFAVVVNRSKSIRAASRADPRAVLASGSPAALTKS